MVVLVSESSPELLPVGLVGELVDAGSGQAGQDYVLLVSLLAG